MPAISLLIQGTWDDIARMSKKQSQWVVLGQPVEEASKVTLDYKAPVAAGIMVLMIAAMVFDFIPIPPVAAVLIAAILMVLTGCFRNVEDAYKTINWGKYRPDSRHAADVAGIGENRSIIAYFRKTCRRTGQLRSVGPDGRGSISRLRC